MTDKQQTLREAFEEWASKKGYGLQRMSNGRYVLRSAARSWEAWQAAARWADGV